jgi:uncharacterized phosphosugar-binding protein
MKAGREYLSAVQEILRRIDLDEVDRAAQLVAAALERGGVIHAFGTGHSSLLAQELFYRAGGLVAVNPVLDPRLGFERGAVESTEFERRPEAADELAAAAGFQRTDAGIVISNSGRNALPIELALRMKAAGMAVIALTNIEQSKRARPRHSSGKRLFEVADVVLDNHCPPGDAAISISGIPHAVGPVSTIAGGAILHCVLLEAAEKLAHKGSPPSTFVSANLGEGSVKELQRLLIPFQSRIRYYRPANQG